MRESDEIDVATINWRKLTPDQWQDLKRRTMRRARYAQAQAVRDLLAGILMLLAATAVGGANMIRLVARRATLVAGKWWNAFGAWRERRAAIRELGALDDRSLKDIGLHRSEIESVIFDARTLLERRGARRYPAARPSKQTAVEQVLQKTAHESMRHADRSWEVLVAARGWSPN